MVKTTGFICRLLSKVNTLVCIIAMFVNVHMNGFTPDKPFFDDVFWRIIIIYFSIQGVLILTIFAVCGLDCFLYWLKLKNDKPKKLTKRDTTPEEEEAALLQNADYWNRCNPNFEISVEEWRNKLTEAKAEGYKSEVCECGITFLAFHHYTTCKKEGCPFSDGVTLLERMKQSCE